MQDKPNVPKHRSKEYLGKPSLARHRGLWYTPGGKLCFNYTAEDGLHWKTAEVQTIKGASAEKAAIVAKKFKGESVAPPPKMTFVDVARQWYESLDVRPKTRDMYDWILRIHLLPYFGTRPIASITVVDIIDFMAQVKTTGDGDGKETTAQAIGRMSQVFKYALRRGWVKSNPVAALDASERPKRRRREKRILTEAELVALLEAEPIAHWRLFFFLLAYTGLRVSEALGLRWHNVDTTNGYVYVRRQLDRKTRESADTKTPAAVRDVPLDPTLGKALIAHRLASKHSGDDDLVFQSDVVGMVGFRASGMSMRFIKALDNAKLADGTPAFPKTDSRRRPVPHDLRHYFASLLIARSDARDIVHISKILGHERPSETTDTYADLFDKEGSEKTVRAVIAASVETVAAAATVSNG